MMLKLHFYASWGYSEETFFGPSLVSTSNRRKEISLVLEGGPQLMTSERKKIKGWR